jgi:TQXA domain-containing protein/LPXTG-motif cell wall-anchored protein
LLVSLLAVFGATALVQPAHADPVTGKLVVNDHGQPEYADRTVSSVKLVGVDREDVSTGLFQLAVEGKVLYTYCIDFFTNAEGGVDYLETDWQARGEGWQEKGAKITWILNHSVPKLRLKDFRQSLKDAGLEFDSEIQLKDAVAVTQAAIWHISDGKDLESDANDEKIVKIYDYLKDKAEHTTPAPKPSLELTPGSLSGKAGEKIGPFTVATTADEVKVGLGEDAPKDVKLVGKDGTPVQNAKDGDKLYVDVPAGTAEGAAKVEAEGSAEVGIGRVFKGRKQTQTMILAGSSKVPVKADAEAKWSIAKVPAAPGAKVTRECAEGGIGVKLTNSAGERGEKATFTVEGKDYREEFTVKAGESKNIVVPVKEDSDYSIKVTSGDFSKELKGHRDCAKPSPTPTPTPTSASPAPGQPAPAPGGGLAHTGANNLGLPLGLGALLLALGGGLLFFLRRKNGQQGEAAAQGGEQ